jgi:hypothetical protein
MRKFILAGLILLISLPMPADSRVHRRTHPAKPPASTAQDDKSSADKASAEIDRALDRSMKSICRGC